jgi:hypothetical protein
MFIDAKVENGYILVCTRSGRDHSFIARRLGPSVECPHCGSTALSCDLATAFFTGGPRPREEAAVHGVAATAAPG